MTQELGQSTENLHAAAHVGSVHPVNDVDVPNMALDTGLDDELDEYETADTQETLKLRSPKPVPRQGESMVSLWLD